MKKGFSKRLVVLIFLALFLFVGDRLLKFWIYHHFPNAQYASPFYPYGGVGVFQNILGIDFCLNRVMNRGGAWGIFSTYPMILICVRLVILAVILCYMTLFNTEKKRTFPLMLIITGALGNVVDYFVYGAVVDMFHFTFWNYSYPVFNIADMLIFSGVTVLLIQSLIKKRYARISRQSP